MIPFIVGAAAVGLAGAALLGGDDKSKQPVKEKRQVSENYVMQQLARAGKNLQGGSASDTKFIPSGDFFGTDFKRIESMLASPNVSNEFISDALDAIEHLAIQIGETNPLNFVEYYRKQLRKRRISSSQRQGGSASDMKFIPSGDFSADFEKIENMLASPNVNDEFISEALNAIENAARRKSFQGTVTLVNHYREKLRQRHGSASGMKFIPSGDFSADFAKIENMLASSNVNDEFISEALNAIENAARRKSFQGTVTLVNHYREKLRKRGR